MSGIKLMLLAVCVSLCGLSFATNNIIAMSCAIIAVIIALVGFFKEDKKN